MNILLLTGKFGLGHYSVACSILKQLSQMENLHVIIQDTLELCLDKHKSEFIYKSFAKTVHHEYHIYNLIYKARDSHTVQFHFPMKYILLLDKLVEKQGVSTIIATLPLAAMLVSDYKRTTGKQVTLITCITDVYSHKDWINPFTDLYLAASSDSKNTLTERGVPEDKIYITGIPVLNQFIDGTQKGKDNYEETHLLIMGGGLGLLPKSKKFYQKLSEMDHMRITVLTGKNKLLFHHIYRKFSNVEVLSFVDNVYEFMQQADVLLSKPGGITLFEAIYCELPIIILPPRLEQEIYNATFLIDHKMGVMLSKKNFAKDLQNKNLHRDLRESMRNFKASINKMPLAEIVKSLN